MKASSSIYDSHNLAGYSFPKNFRNSAKIYCFTMHNKSQIPSVGANSPGFGAKDSKPAKSDIPLIPVRFWSDQRGQAAVLSWR